MYIKLRCHEEKKHTNRSFAVEWWCHRKLDQAIEKHHCEHSISLESEDTEWTFARNAFQDYRQLKVRHKPSKYFTQCSSCWNPKRKTALKNCSISPFLRLQSITQRENNSLKGFHNLLVWLSHCSLWQCHWRYKFGLYSQQKPNVLLLSVFSAN